MFLRRRAEQLSGGTVKRSGHPGPLAAVAVHRGPSKSRRRSEPAERSADRLCRRTTRERPAGAGVLVVDTDRRRFRAASFEFDTRFFDCDRSATSETRSEIERVAVFEMFPRKTCVRIRARDSVRFLRFVKRAKCE